MLHVFIPVLKNFKARDLPCHDVEVAKHEMGYESLARRTACSHLCKHEHSQGLLSVSSVLQAAPASAVTFVAYEFFISFLLNAAAQSVQAGGGAGSNHVSEQHMHAR
jgi:hypothetical protein